MMFDTLVCGLEEEELEVGEEFEIFRGSKPVENQIFRKTYYSVSDHPDLSDVGDLSWDEGDLPHHHIKVWTFNDFMGQYNQLYAFLNNIQVQYHTDKRAPHSTSP